MRGREGRKKLHPVVSAFILNRIAWEDFAKTYGNTDFWEPIDGEGSVIRGQGIREGNGKIRKLIGEDSHRVDEGKVDDGQPLAVIIVCRSPHWDPFRVLYVEALVIEPVNKLICPRGLAGMGEGPIDGMGVEVTHEECGDGLV